VANDFDAIHHHDINGVVIATPISTHLRLEGAALQAGKHVLVKKPLTTNTLECWELIALAEQNHRV
jgi:predicted dehydrogenase